MRKLSPLPFIGRARLLLLTSEAFSCHVSSATAPVPSRSSRTSVPSTRAAVTLMDYRFAVPLSMSAHNRSRPALCSTRKNLYCCDSSRRSSTRSSRLPCPSTVSSTRPSRSSYSWSLRFLAAASAMGRAWKASSAQRSPPRECAWQARYARMLD